MRKWITVAALNVLLVGCSLFQEAPGVPAAEDAIEAVLAGVLNSMEIVTAGEVESAIGVAYASESLDGSATFNGTVTMTDVSFLLEGTTRFNDHESGHLSYSLNGAINYRQAMTSTGSMLISLGGLVLLDGGDITGIRFVDFEVEADFVTETYVASSGTVMVGFWIYDAHEFF